MKSDAAVMRRLLWCALALPGVGVALLTGVSGASTLLAGRPVILAPTPASLGEAAANRDAGDVVIRLAAGEDANQPALVRIPQRFDEPLTMTPLEAAVASQRWYMVKLLIDNGARLDATTLRRIRCLAAHWKDRGTIEYLATLDASPVTCDDVALPE